MNNEPPRTPPALSNATPLHPEDVKCPKCESEPYHSCYYVNNGGNFTYLPKPHKERIAAAAPPVAEGPALSRRSLQCRGENNDAASTQRQEALSQAADIAGDESNGTTEAMSQLQPQNGGAADSIRPVPDNLQVPMVRLQQERGNKQGVAEGPAATPRTQPYYAKIAMASGCNNDAALGAAAEPPEARAAARWIKEQQFQWVENCAIAQDKDSGDAWDEDYVYLPELLTRYADDLQRQLDEARRELGISQRNIEFNEKTYLEQHGGSWGKCKYQAQVESAEAANQELRVANMKWRAVLREIENNDPGCDCPHDTDECCARAAKGDTFCAHCIAGWALAALLVPSEVEGLGPQPGDTK